MGFLVPIPALWPLLILALTRREPLLRPYTRMVEQSCWLWPTQTVGVREGLIIDPRWAEQSVSDAVASAENLANMKVTKAYVALSIKWCGRSPSPWNNP